MWTLTAKSGNEEQYGMSDSPSATESLAVFVASTDYGALPAEVITATKQRILDTVGVALSLIHISEPTRPY